MSDLAADIGDGYTDVTQNDDDGSTVSVIQCPECGLVLKAAGFKRHFGAAHGNLTLDPEWKEQAYRVSAFELAQIGNPNTQRKASKRAKKLPRASSGLPYLGVPKYDDLFPAAQQNSNGQGPFPRQRQQSLLCKGFPRKQKGADAYFLLIQRGSDRQEMWVPIGRDGWPWDGPGSLPTDHVPSGFLKPVKGWKPPDPSPMKASPPVPEGGFSPV